MNARSDLQEVTTQCCCGQLVGAAAMRIIPSLHLVCPACGRVLSRKTYPPGYAPWGDDNHGMAPPVIGRLLARISPQSRHRPLNGAAIQRRWIKQIRQLFH